MPGHPLPILPMHCKIHNQILDERLQDYTFEPLSDILVLAMINFLTSAVLIIYLKRNFGDQNLSLLRLVQSIQLLPIPGHQK
jgi:hypothetical protein